MSNYHYKDQGSCQSCIDKSSYSDLKDTTNYSCDQPCLCRFDEGRSTKDKMYYNWFVLNKPMVLPSPGKNLPQQNAGNCGGENN